MKKLCTISCLMFLTVLFMSALYAQDYAPGWEKKTLTKLDGSSENPALAMFKKKHHAVWKFDDKNYNPWIYYNRSLNSGTSWKKNYKLYQFKSLEYSSGPDIAVWKKYVHVIFQRSSYSDDDILYLRSTNNGKKWKKAVLIAKDNGDVTYPKIASVSKAVHVVWVQKRPNNSSSDQAGEIYDIYYKRSMNKGATWGEAKNLSSTTDQSMRPQIVVYKSSVHVVWADWIFQGEKFVSSNNFYIKSTNNGNSWSLPKKLNTQSSEIQAQGFVYYPEIALSHGAAFQLAIFFGLMDCKYDTPNKLDSAPKTHTCWTIDHGSGFGPVQTLPVTPTGYYIEYMCALDAQTLFAVWFNADKNTLQSAKYSMATGERQGGFSPIKVFNKDAFSSFNFKSSNGSIWGIGSEAIQQRDYSMKSNIETYKSNDTSR